MAEDGTLIAGHGRILAARQIGIEQIPVMIAKGWSDTQIRAYRIADNKLTENASWDQEMLHLEFKDLRAADFDLALTGFEEQEINEVMTEKPFVDFKEYDESVADKVEYIECPKCSHRWPK